MKKSKKNKKLDFDKMSFEDRENLREKLKQERVYTKTFWTEQSFGAASEVKQISIDEYLKEKANENE